MHDINEKHKQAYVMLRRLLNLGVLCTDLDDSGVRQFIELVPEMRAIVSFPSETPTDNDGENDKYTKLRVERDELEYKLGALLCHATGGLWSKASYSLDDMRSQVDAHIERTIEEAVKDNDDANAVWPYEIKLPVRPTKAGHFPTVPKGVAFDLALANSTQYNVSVAHVRYGEIMIAIRDKGTAAVFGPATIWTQVKLMMGLGFDSDARNLADFINDQFDTGFARQGTYDPRLCADG